MRKNNYSKRTKDTQESWISIFILPIAPKLFATEVDLYKLYLTNTISCSQKTTKKIKSSSSYLRKSKSSVFQRFKFIYNWLWAKLTNNIFFFNVDKQAICKKIIFHFVPKFYLMNNFHCWKNSLCCVKKKKHSLLCCGDWKCQNKINQSIN
jgi:hypothetical protein